MVKIAVFISGTGSLLEAMIKDRLEICLVLADRDCPGLEFARKAKIPVELIEREDFGKTFDRRKYTREIVIILKKYEIGLVAMAGFMTILDPFIFESGYKGRILNTHPALLPAFKGDHAVKDALEYGVKFAGCTIHVATEELDAGTILAQEVVKVLPGDTEKVLHERIKVVERILYPLTIRQYARILAQI